MFSSFFSSGAINWEKAQLQAKLVLTYRKFQENNNTKPKFASNEQIQSFLNNVHPMEDDELLASLSHVNREHQMLEYIHCNYKKKRVFLSPRLLSRFGDL